MNSNIVNNSRFIGDRMAFTSEDVLACPPPLFHCFGLVLGLMACVTHGSKIVLPGEVFDAEATLRAISDEQCTALHGVPAMFDSILSLPRPAGFDCTKLRTGIIAGAPVPRHLMEGILVELGMTEYTSSYGKLHETQTRRKGGEMCLYLSFVPRPSPTSPLLCHPVHDYVAP